MDSMKIVVRVPNWVGDSILALPALNTIKKNFPDDEIWLAAQDWVKDLFSMTDYENCYGFLFLIDICDCSVVSNA